MAVSYLLTTTARRSASKAAAPSIRSLSVISSKSSGGGSNCNDNTTFSHTLLATIGGATLLTSASYSSSNKSTTQCEPTPDLPEPNIQMNMTRRMTIRHDEHFSQPLKEIGAAFPLQPTHSKEVPGPKGIPSRSQQIQKLQTKGTKDVPYDVLVIGGGATGAGIAFDAATRTTPDGKPSDLKVACIERGDFASETSSRSTKLIWAGIKYLASASAALLSVDLFTSPISTIQAFMDEFGMVFNCHQERKYMLDKQRHLTNWIPIVCPFTEWHIWPPPFGHWLFSFFPILAPAVFKFYDGLSQFTCPPSFIMSSKESRTKFPQLNDKDIKYCAVFYEGQHNDARTNLAIALSAAEKGADIANYVEMTEGIFAEDGKVVGVKATDRVTGKTLEIYAKHIIFAGGPFTDALRQKEDGTSRPVKTAVQGASGTHIVLPGYYAPSDMGLLDYKTSDGRFLFFLPWQGSVIVGTTDKKGPAETLPYPPEEEIQWLLKECEKYLSKDLKVRRSDVLSAWRGWRPLAADPHAEPGAQVSRDHVISTNPKTDVTFIAGGKWTTWREMAEDALDKVLGKDHPKCNTLDIVLHGGEGYSENLSIQLIQKYGLLDNVAEHLANTYGGRAWEVMAMCKPTGKQWPRNGIPLAANYPYIEAEVRFAAKEYACTIEDILSRRTRLAFLNSEAALEAVPRVADIMAEELGWSRKVKRAQIEEAKNYLETYGGRVPVEDDYFIRVPTLEEASELFREVDRDGSGYLDEDEIRDMSIQLGMELSAKEVKAVFKEMDTDRDGKVTSEEFVEWMNKEHDKTGFKKGLTLGGTKWLDDKQGGGFLG